MKTRTREIARTGVFGHDAAGEKKITKRTLSEIVRNFANQKTAPVVLGHDFSAKSARLGNVVALHLADGGASLVAEIEENDALSRAVDEGFFPDCSIGAKANASGEYYLHHLAYLGEEPPAIKNLRKEISDSLAAADGGNFEIFPSVALRCTIKLSDEGEPMDEVEKLKTRNAELEAKVSELEKKLSEATSDGSSVNADGALKKENEELKKRVSELEAKIEKIATEHPDIELSDREAALYGELKSAKKSALMKSAEGKLSKTAAEKLSRLADFLDARQTIALSDAQKTSALELLSDIFESANGNDYLKSEIAFSDSSESEAKNAPTLQTLMQCV